MKRDLAELSVLERMIFWLAAWMSNSANHVRPNTDGLRIGSQQCLGTQHPTMLAWLGSVRGHLTRPLGVDHSDRLELYPTLYRHFGIDFGNAVSAANAFSRGRPIRC